MTTVNKVLERLIGRTQPEEEPLSEKMEALRKSVDEVQKYELLTTNQYLQQMDIIVSILKDIQTQVDCAANA
jgi:guanylate kinase